MLHKTLEAKATTTTDQGSFVALAATYAVDRTNERIVPGAFADTIKAWQKSGKQIPLHWDHMGEAENVIGTIDPASMKETADGLEVKGQLDLEDSQVAREAWRLMKKNAVGLSFGYLVNQDAKGADGVRELKSIDLFEITITPAPVNPDTRFLDLKALKAMSPTQMATKLRELAVAIAGDDPVMATDREVAAAMRAMADEIESMGKSLDSPDEVLLAPDVVIAGTELKGVQEGDLKAVWTAAYVNSLPDSAFLYVESGGSKDGEGKTTPRSLRHFPYKDASGAVDLPHLRNALARIPQSNLPQDVKDRLTAKAQRILDSMKSLSDEELAATQAIEDRAEEPERAKVPQDPLVQQYDETVFELTTRGLDTSKPVAEKSVDEPTPTLEELEDQLDGIELDILTRGEAR